MWSGIKSPVAYFSAEFGIDNDLPTYSGGLGILAADIISEAADQDYPFVGVGILYKGKNFIQHITSEGFAETRDSQFDHDSSFLRQTTNNGKPVVIELDVNGQTIFIKSYHIRLSDNTVLFFLSTDLDVNPPEWVSDMDALYIGDTDSQIRQQIILGVGGVKLLNALSITPRIYHINEGRPSFLVWGLTQNIMKKENLDFGEAWKKSVEKIVYTNHTLVAAGNLVYPIESVKKWSASFAEKMGVESDLIVKDGIDPNGNFSITQFSLNVSSKQSAVSSSHAKGAQTSWPKYKWISITNGVHMPRWQDSDYRKKLSDTELWELHMKKKRELVASVVQRTGIGFDPNRLTIAWARRLAEYKRPTLIFSDLERLKRILQNKDYPIQLIFAGNSHTADSTSKPLIEEVIKLFASELAGSAIFVPNYNISLANHLTSGADVWLNTPQGNLEACGTSGMKAAANGVINFTVLDGWTYEVDWKDIGYVIDPTNSAESIYKTLEEEIVPTFYEKNGSEYPQKWLLRMRKSITMSEQFSSKRAFEDYKKKLYA